jgi:hypothetical protein
VPSLSGEPGAAGVAAFVAAGPIVAHHFGQVAPVSLHSPRSTAPVSSGNARILMRIEIFDLDESAHYLDPQYKR